MLKKNILLLLTLYNCSSNIDTNPLNRESHPDSLVRIDDDICLKQCLKSFEEDSRRKYKVAYVLSNIELRKVMYNFKEGLFFRLFLTNTKESMTFERSSGKRTSKILSFYLKLINKDEFSINIPDNIEANYIIGYLNTKIGKERSYSVVSYENSLMLSTLVIKLDLSMIRRDNTFFFALVNSNTIYEISLDCNDLFDSIYYVENSTTETVKSSDDKDISNSSLTNDNGEYSNFKVSETLNESDCGGKKTNELRIVERPESEIIVKNIKTIELSPKITDKSKIDIK